MSSADVRRLLFEQFARVGKALGHASRLELLDFLAQGERPVEALARLAGLSVANTSRHLQVLRRAGLAACRREGSQVFYRVADEAVIELVDVVRRLARRRLDEVQELVDRYLSALDGLEPVSAAELLHRLREGEVTLIDVRPREEFEAGHIPGALNVPLREIDGLLHRLPPGREVVAYCRGPYCVLSYEAVDRLRRGGVAARRFAEGFPEWRLAGLPVARGGDRGESGRAADAGSGETAAAGRKEGE
ncbi:metalloregulator ArsR/SmtB family transcription factor [Dissulfurirhabdus thermomarina]|uniref:Metalloregulator ArsR/SmtB family transcription factor n=1 Tax=Dissulfurirhabdus thermomarina TaxID=1765737 RepID=A0A6N9TS11_DISTH|nr:metalloregulator ArsR/SmtB family transcription factor [Dissulfurirhabdus thermomarina]NDY43210.1 metalloregulator ArsR/SmtB family transcription factor [Dissulfurirhabdus thermomarina]NMX23928.1 metalloregulator ArsR/SmtB family transcription factor [Dissulfurirhabdus thermomarina]